jgi:hypothetical protein
MASVRWWKTSDSIKKLVQDIRARMPERQGISATVIGLERGTIGLPTPEWTPAGLSGR